MTVGANFKTIAFIAVAAAAGGCSNLGDLSTSSVNAGTTPVAQKSDPVCASLAGQISTLKSDGSIDRLEKAAAGKGSKVAVKREALQKQAELNRANADFQMRCGPQLPNQVAMQTATPPVAPTAPAAPTTAPAAPSN